MNNTTIILYHGSNQPVYRPRVDQNRFTTDFGKGFYLTTSRSQAEKWAQRKAKYLGRPILNKYVFNIDQKDLKILTYQADISWVKFIIQNRTHSFKINADIVIGPTADGKLFSVISYWKHGNLDLGEALLQLKPKIYAKQYCFKTIKALQALKFLEKENLNDSRN